MHIKVKKRLYANITVEFALFLATGVIITAIFSVIYFVIQNYIKNQYVRNFKDASAIIFQATSKSQSENGKLTTWDYSDKQTQEKFAWIYIVPYMDIGNDCGIRKNEGCFAPKTYYKYLNGTKSGTIFDETQGYKFVHRAGMSFYVSFVPDCVNHKQRCFDIYVDVNGPKRGPSQFGRDLFLFYAYPFTNEIKPFGVYSNDKSAYDAEHNRWKPYPYKSDCKRSGWGATCGMKIMSEGFEMKY